MKKKGHDRWIREITWKTRVEKNKIKKNHCTSKFIL